MTDAKPQLAEYTVEWDEQKQLWHAYNERGSLYGRNQRELELGRNRRVMMIADEILEACRYAAVNGYSPPPP